MFFCIIPGGYNNVVGGVGGFISRAFPGKFFVLVTGTAAGTFTATTDPRDTYDNVMKAYPLEQPLKPSWETVLSGQTGPAIFLKAKSMVCALSVTGLKAAIKDMHAATPLDEKAK